MTLLLLLLCCLILLILSYPFWLYLFTTEHYKFNQNKKVDEVSLIFLSHNGGRTIAEKLSVIINNLEKYRNWELIIIDNASESETLSILSSFSTNKNVTVLYQETNIGVANAMNLGVKVSKYNYLLFSDQRQLLNEADFDKLLTPLLHNEIGAVSAKISSFDKEGNYSFIRAYENFIKKQESKTGSVVGVYGPLFSLKKELYVALPENIILDDLYLSLNILRTKKILFATDVIITDNNFRLLYNKTRANSYFSGLLQLLKEPGLTKGLSSKTMLFLFWHKYFRLFIPFLLLLCTAIVFLTFFHGNGKYLTPLILLTPLLFVRVIRLNMLTALFININYLEASSIKYARVAVKKLWPAWQK